MPNAKVGAIHELPQEQPRTNPSQGDLSLHTKSKEGPWQAFAVVGDRDDPDALAVLM